MRATTAKLYTDVKTAPSARPRTRIALTSPLFAFGAAAVGSVAVWVGLFKLILG
jgi:hypothetical protein